MKTIRLKPSQEEKSQLLKMFESFRWYYNHTVSCFNYLKECFQDEYKTIFYGRSVSYTKLRDLIRRIKYQESERCRYFSFEKENIGFPDCPNGKVHNRIPRGAIKSFVGNINSAFSNNHIFTMKYKRKSEQNEECLFEDKKYPDWLKDIVGFYKNKKKNVKSKSILNTSTSGILLYHDKLKNKFYIKVPIKASVNKVESQDLISLDPGIRTFQTGYSPSGHTIEFGKNACFEMKKHLEKVDYYQSKYDTTKFKKFKTKQLCEYQKIRNKIADLHWKTIKNLTDNYDVILLPDFRISQMVTKGKHLNKSVKRLMYLFSFHMFKTRLLWKASLKGKIVKIVDESYTSMTCGRCGVLNRKLGSKKIFHCENCDLTIDRDINASRNILLKNASA